MLKNIKMKNIKIITAIAFCLSITACSDDFLEKNPKGIVFEEMLDPQDALIGAYAALSGGSSTGDQATSGAASVRNWAWNVASDDAYKGTAQGDTDDVEEIERYTVLATNPWLNGKWRVSYDGIARANDVLRILEAKGGELDPQQKTVMEAQARCIRAWWHFRLLQVFYQVPYIHHLDENPATVKNDRSIWDEIENDFQFAIDNLPESFPGEPGRFTKYAAMGYKAYAHLFQSEYAEAQPLLDQIINSGKYNLVENFQDNYSPLTENNIESLFEIQSSVNNGTNTPRNGNSDSWVTLPMNRFLPTCCNVYQPSQDLVDAYKVNDDGLPLLGINGPKYNDITLKNDMGLGSDEEFIPTDELLDPRLDHTVGRRGIPYQDWGVHTGNEWVRSQSYGGPYSGIKPMFYKKDQAIASHASYARANALNFRALRYAHILLWRAECAVEENDLDRARELVNRVRRRAANPVNIRMGKVNTFVFDGREIDVDYTKPAANYKIEEYSSFPTQTYAREAVRMELRLETAMEGNRFFDLVRWGIASQVMNEYIQNESQFRPVMRGTQFIEGKNEYWPLPQAQLDLQPDVLTQDPSHN